MSLKILESVAEESAHRDAIEAREQKKTGSYVYVGYRDNPPPDQVNF
jgi:hypothetical protein